MKLVLRLCTALAGLVCSTLMLAPIADAGAKPGRSSKEAAPFTRGEDLLKWMNGYRLNPEPRRLPAAVKAMIDFGLTKDLDQAGIYIGFTAGVIGSNPDNAEQLIEKMFPMQPEDQVLLIRAIAYSGLDDWKPLLGKFVERMPARKLLIDKFMFGKKPVLADLAMAEDQSAIDLNWGYYFATGSEAPIRRIVGVLPWSLDKNNIEKLTIGAMAKWTMAQNASRDIELLRMLKRATDDTPAARVPLNEIIEAAETLELAKIRKQALASIEELKVKGSERSRNFSFWGQTGQTVLALGCVAASVMGQVEFGIPCVVGGALSSAALKYLTP